MAQHSFWVIVDGHTPTSFRSRQQEDLLPTLAQLKRTQPEVRLMWFERGRMWASPTEAREALIVRRTAPTRRPREWRPGGDHVDPRAKYDISRDQKRARFKARAIRDRQDGGPKPDTPVGQGPHPRPDRPPSRPQGRPPFRPSGDRPFRSGGPDRRPPFRGRPEGDRRSGDRPHGDRRPPSDRPRGDRPPSDRPRGSRPFDDRPPGDRRPPKDRWSGNDRRPPQGDRSSNDRRPPHARSDRPGPPRPRPDEGAKPPAPRGAFGDKPAKFGNRPWRPKKPGQSGRPWQPGRPWRPGKPKGGKGGR